MSKVWFITGSSRGFGRVWAEAALQRGDRVAATARNVDTLADLVDRHADAVLPLPLDVTDRAADFAAVDAAFAHFGRLDVVINNAGYGLFGAIVELSEAQVRAQIETNLFGAMWVTQAALPHLREQGSGHIIQASSIGGIAAFPNVGAYHASKWALEGFSDALSQEVARFGIFVTLIEPGGFETDWAGNSAVRATPHPAYDEMRANRPPVSPTRGDPGATPAAILKLVDAETPPLRLLLGEMPTQLTKRLYADRLETWAEWEDVSLAAQGN